MKDDGGLGAELDDGATRDLRRGQLVGVDHASAAQPHDGAAAPRVQHDGAVAVQRDDDRTAADAAHEERLALFAAGSEEPGRVPGQLEAAARLDRHPLPDPTRIGVGDQGDRDWPEPARRFGRAAGIDGRHVRIERVTTAGGPTR